MPRMTERGEAPLSGKLTIRAGGRKVVLVKQAWESERHVLLKALVFGLYVGAHPALAVERAIGHRFKPDLVALGPDGRPAFWAECGDTGREKLAHLARALPATHLVLARQVGSLAPFEAIARAALEQTRRTAPVDLLNVPADADRYLGADGRITIGFENVTVVRL